MIWSRSEIVREQADLEDEVNSYRVEIISRGIKPDRVENKEGILGSWWIWKLSKFIIWV